jgi:hypothetical protein
MSVTPRDVRLGEIYYRYLLELAREAEGATIRYGELVARARRDFPDDPLVKGAIPISIGNRLLIIERFCIENALPNLACLAVNASGKPGKAYIHDWEREMARVAAFDWSTVEAAWGLHADAWRAAATPKPKLVKRTREEAEQMFVEHWRADLKNKPPRYPGRIDDRPKEAIIRHIAKGHAPAQAFDAVLFGTPL